MDAAGEPVATRSTGPALPTPSTARAPASRGRANLELIMVGLGALVVSLSQSVLIPVLGQLPGELHASITEVSWLITVVLLVGAVTVPIMGRLGDMYGKRLMLLVSVFAMVLGSVITALTSNVALLIAGRAVQGISLAAIPLGISLLAAVMPTDRVGSATALISAMLGIGGALGLPLAGLVAEHADFHVLFWITGGVAAVSFVGILLLVPEAPGERRGRLDVPGSLILSAALVALILPLEEGSTWGWTSPPVIGLLLGSAVLFIAFMAFERRVAEPVVDLASLRRRPIVLTDLASVAFGFALFASFLGTANFVEAPKATGYGFGSSLVVGGLTLLPSGLGMLLFSPVAGRMLGRIGAGPTLACGALAVALGYLLRIVDSGHLASIFVSATIVGVGTGIGYAAMPTLINANTPPSEIAAANGLNSLSRAVGSSLAAAIGNSILTSNVLLVDGVEYPSLTAYRWLFAVCAVAGVVAAGLISLLRARPVVLAKEPVTA
jgi:MFS family permease